MLGAIKAIAFRTSDGTMMEVGETDGKKLGTTQGPTPGSTDGAKLGLALEYDDNLDEGDEL